MGQTLTVILGDPTGSPGAASVTISGSQQICSVRSYPYFPSLYSVAVRVYANWGHELGGIVKQKVACGMLLATGLLLLTGCGGGSGGTQPPPPTITLTTLVPDHVNAGAGGTTLFADGGGFTSSSVVQWNGTPLPTTFGSDKILTASISSALVAQPGSAKITVQDGSASSKALVFGIASPAAATAGVIGLITLAMDGSPANGESGVAPSISATGRYVTFQSDAPNLAPGPLSGFGEIYERDTCIGAPSGCTPSTVRITVTYGGSPANDHSRDSAISANGRYVVFDSGATNILPNTAICGRNAGFSCTFLRDTCIGVALGCSPRTVVVSVDTQGGAAPGGSPTITPDGRFAAFASGASNLIPVDTNGTGDVFLRDTCIGTVAGCSPNTVLVSLSTGGTQGDQTSSLQAVSGTGRYVAFQSSATNLVPNETIQPGMFFRDTCIGAASGCTPATTRVDVSTSGTEGNGGVFPAGQAITGDGRLVAFTTQATNLVATNVNGFGNLYVRDTCAGAPPGCAPSTSLASLANDGTVGNAPSPSQGLGMTPDGRFIVFDSIATNLVPGDTFPAGGFEDIFVRDTCYGIASGCVPSTVRVSVANTPFPETPGDSISGRPAISADGHYAVFLSAATNLAPGVTGNGHTMVYLAKTGF